jgi:hypothetical protein
MKITIFWDVAPCSLALMMEAISTYETSVNVYRSTWRNIPDDNQLKIEILLIV